VKPLLVAESIGKAFGDRKILASARLEARPGVVTLVAGRNGAGKSTLLKIVAGQLAPDYGTIRFGEHLFTKPSLPQLARQGLFFLPDREILSPSFTLREQLTIFSRRFQGRAVEDVAESLRIAKLLDRAPGAFSGGELRRAELALALVRAPRCLMADEPLRGIDPKDSDLLLECLRALARDGCAVIISGHEVKTLLGASDEVVWVTSGTSYFLGAPDDALQNERFRREYLTGSWT
jgi:ABC-type multidrug transport system ATPase subunit